MHSPGMTVLMSNATSEFRRRGNDEAAEEKTRQRRQPRGSNEKSTEFRAMKKDVAACWIMWQNREGMRRYLMVSAVYF